jgi:hypothetical protein
MRLSDCGATSLVSVLSSVWRSTGLTQYASAPSEKPLPLSATSLMTAIGIAWLSGRRLSSASKAQQSSPCRRMSRMIAAGRNALSASRASRRFRAASS